MSRRKTTSEFIKEAQAVHGDLYNYSKAEYTGGKAKVLIIDPEYGEFWQRAENHLMGQGNPKRGKKKSENSRRKTIEQFVNEAQTVHNNLYDYSKVEYKDTHTKVLIIDPEYGEFYQTPDNHLSGQGSPKRKIELLREAFSMTTSEFIKRSREVHGDLYSYSKVEYIKTSTKVLIIDPEYGEFWQTPAAHLKGSGHPIRGKTKAGLSRRKTTSKFIQQAKSVHGNLYDYSKTKYITTHNKVLIIDSKYGEFWQSPSHHLNGQGHPLRGRDSTIEKQRNTLEEFVNKARLIHGDLYDYSKVDYVNTNTKVLIIDPEYGEFWQSPNSHLRGTGNPKRGVVRMQKAQTKTQEEFLHETRLIHGDLYDYSKAKYTGAFNKITIICSKHGEFKQTPDSHRRGSGCPKCVGKNKTTDEFIAQARKVHGDLYDYSKVEYIGTHKKLLIIDPEFGEFWQEAASHLSGVGSPIRKGGVKITTDEFIKRAKTVHGDLYSYLKVKYTGAFDKVLIIDPEYGEFWQEANVHLQGSGNPERGGTVKLNTESFIDRAIDIHGDLYNYSKVSYINVDTPVTIIDPTYGEFSQRPEVHLRGSGHPKRAHYGFDLEKPAILYYLKINKGIAYKIGITGNSLAERFGSDMQYIDVVKIWEYKVGEDAYIKEQKILSDYFEFKYTGDYLLKSGNTELFNKDVLGLDV